MIKDGEQFIHCEGIGYKCSFAGYFNPIQHKWKFVIDGVDSNIFSSSEIYFLETKFTVCFTERNSEINKTSIDAWII